MSTTINPADILFVEDFHAEFPEVQFTVERKDGTWYKEVCHMGGGKPRSSDQQEHAVARAVIRLLPQMRPEHDIRWLGASGDPYRIVALRKAASCNDPLRISPAAKAQTLSAAVADFHKDWPLVAACTTVLDTMDEVLRATEGMSSRRRMPPVDGAGTMRAAIYLLRQACPNPALEDLLNEFEPRFLQAYGGAAAVTGLLDPHRALEICAPARRAMATIRATRGPMPLHRPIQLADGVASLRAAFYVLWASNPNAALATVLDKFEALLLLAAG